MLCEKGQEKALFSCSLLQRKSFQPFNIEYDVSYGIFIYGFYYVEVLFFYSWFECLYHERVLSFFQMLSSASVETILWVLVFILLIRCVKLIFVC